MESTKPPSSSPCNSETNNNHQIRDAPQRLIFILIDFRHFLSHILKDLQLALTGRRIVKSATQILIVIRQIQIHRPSKRPKSLLLGAANPILIRKKPQFVSPKKILKNPKKILKNPKEILKNPKGIQKNPKEILKKTLMSTLKKTLKNQYSQQRGKPHR